MAIANPAIWRPNTRQWIIADALLKNGFTAETPKGSWKGYRAAVRRELDSMLEAQIEPMVFRGNRPDGSGYGVLAINTQGQRLWYVIHDVMKAIAEHGWDREAGLVAAAEETQTPVAEPDPEPAQINASDELKSYVAEVRRIRDWLAQHDPEGEIDHISYRPIKDGRRMIEAGIPAKACLHAMTLHWDRADRQRAGIVDYDPATEFPGGLRAYLKALVAARVLIMLTGPAGMGKSFWTHELAAQIGHEGLASVPMNEGAGPSWLLGKDMASGYKEASFQRVWRGGGVIGLEEMDASDPNLLLLVNDALANGVLDNPVCGERFERHPETVIVALTNTFGLGADDQYGARNELDFSTIDRFRMGRAFVGYSREVEDQIAFG